MIKMGITETIVIFICLHGLKLYDIFNNHSIGYTSLVNGALSHTIVP